MDVYQIWDKPLDMVRGARNYCFRQMLEEDKQRVKALFSAPKVRT